MRGSPAGFARKAFSNPCFAIGAALVAALFLFTLAGVIYTPYPPNKIDRTAVSLGPDLRHPFGTDNLGRDILSRVMYAGRTAFAVGMCTAALSFLAGTLLGIVSGFSAAGNHVFDAGKPAAGVGKLVSDLSGGRAARAVRRSRILTAGAADVVLTRLADVMRCIPAILLAMMIIAVFGSSLINTIFAISVIYTPSFYRIVRSGVIQIKGREYVTWARIAGVKKWRIMFLHILPNLTSSLIVMTSLTIAQAILAETALTYLGLGVQPPTPSWGRMLSEAQRSILSAPWESVSVGVCVSLMILGFNLLGDGLRDTLDVRLD